MTENQKKISSMVLLQLDANASVSEEQITQLVAMFDVFNVQCGAVPLTESEKAEVIADLHAKLFVRIDRGACVKDREHAPWYNAAKSGGRRVHSRKGSLPPKTKNTVRTQEA